MTFPDEGLTVSKRFPDAAGTNWLLINKSVGMDIVFPFTTTVAFVEFENEYICFFYLNGNEFKVKIMSVKIGPIFCFYSC